MAYNARGSWIKSSLLFRKRKARFNKTQAGQDTSATDVLQDWYLEQPQTETSGLGELTVSGFAPVLVLTIAAAVGQLLITGFDPTVSVSSSGTTADTFTGQATVTGFAPVVVTTINTGTGQTTITGIAPVIDSKINVGLGQAVFNGFAPSIVTGGGTVANASTGVVSLSGFAPLVTIVHLPPLIGSGQTINLGLTGEFRIRV